ncbi:MAG: hypothetical protein GX247_04935 [Mollicutes bacterium]|jgi:hypothetical protein|nr:hypothetical protein [Mollicutes bacterium]
MKKSIVYKKVKEFKRKYPLTVAWRIKAHSKVIDIHLNEGEEVFYAFAAQKGPTNLNVATTYVVALTNKRILLAHKRLFFGYFFIAITPDLFNDLNIEASVFWGKVLIDTVKEVVSLTNIQRQALPEIETEISEYMMREKKKYAAYIAARNSGNQ